MTLTFWTSSADPERIVQCVHVEKRKCCEPSAKASGERSMQGEGDAAPSRGVRHSEGGEGRGARVGGARARRAEKPSHRKKGGVARFLRAGGRRLQLYALLILYQGERDAGPVGLPATRKEEVEVG